MLPDRTVVQYELQFILQTSGENHGTPVTDREAPTPSTTSTMTSSVSEARLKQLERENMHLREQVNKHSLGRSGRVIREIGKKPREGGQDTLNHGVILPKVEEIFYNEKFWTNHWEIYNTDKNSICTRVMSVVSVPMGMSPAVYYQDTVVPKIVNKWKNLKTNFYEKTRVWWTKQLRAESSITNEITNLVVHPIKGLFANLLNPDIDYTNPETACIFDLTFAAVEQLYVVLHNVTRYLYTQVSMREWAQKNKGKPLYLMFTGNEYAFTMFVIMNFKGPWKQAWDYHQENEYVPKAEKDNFAKYSVMSKEDAEKGDREEVLLWEKYSVVKPRFTNTKKARDAERASLMRAWLSTGDTTICGRSYLNWTRLMLGGSSFTRYGIRRIRKCNCPRR
eukprot:scaffold987_cov39-Cyclotella_meneghiniana.AAC.4